MLTPDMRTRGPCGKMRAFRACVSEVRSARAVAASREGPAAGGRVEATDRGGASRWAIFRAGRPPPFLSVGRDPMGALLAPGKRTVSA